jgi:aspartate aminotransferase
LIDRGDEALVIAPYWLSYPEMVKAAEGKSKILQTQQANQYKINPDDLEKAISPATKLLFLNSPSNPTGTLYSKTELQAIGKVLENHPKVWIISDEIYDRIDFTGEWCSFLKANPKLRDRTVTVNGLSKSGAMTGWRIGWSLTPEVLTKALIALQGHSTSGICSLSQAAAVAALKLPKSDFEPQRKEYLHRRNLALELLKKSAKMRVYEPAGAFYLFLDLQAFMKGEENADGFAEKLLQQIQVAVVSGVDFGAPTCVRISFATDENTIRTACERLVEFCNTL